MMSLKDRFFRLLRGTTPHATLTQPITGEVAETPYYREMSLRFASAQFVIYMMLGVFLAVTLLTGTDRLSIENMTYFIKDLNTSVIVGEAGASESLTYASDENNDYALYRGGLAVLGRENLTVFTATGRESYTDSVTYHTPRLLSSGRYLLAYDLGGDEYALYNSFSSIHEKKTTTPIRSAAISDAGYYCIITDGTTYASEIVLYDDMFRPVNTLYLKEYAVCAAIRPSGRQMAVASVSSNVGQLATELALCTPGEQQYQTVTLQDCYPIALSYTSEDILMLYTTLGLYCLDEKGTELAFYPVDPDTVDTVTLNADGCTMLSRSNNYNAGTNVTVFDKNGDMSYNMVTDERVLDAVLLGDTLCLRFQNALSIYEQASVFPISAAPIEGSYLTVLPYSDDEVLLCGQARAICVTVDLP